MVFYTQLVGAEIVFAWVVGGYEDKAALGVGIHPLAVLPYPTLIEIGTGLIEHEDGGIGKYGLCQLYTLFHTR